MSIHLREPGKLRAALIGGLGLLLLALTVANLESWMKSAGSPHFDARNQLAGGEGEKKSAASPSADGSEPLVIAPGESLADAIRRRFGMVKVGDVWLPVASGTDFTAGKKAGGPAMAAASGQPLRVPLYITTGSLPRGRAGAAYQAGLRAVGGVPPYLWSIDRGSLAGGLRLDRASGEISGTASSEGSALVRIRVTDAAGGADVAEFLHTIGHSGSDAAASASLLTADASAQSTSEAAAEEPSKPSPQPLVITTASLPDATAGADFTAQLSASGGSPPYFWSAISPLPAGLMLDAGGLLSGTAVDAAVGTVTIAVADQASQSAAKTFPLRVLSAGKPAVSGLTAWISLRRIALSWANPADASLTGVRIVRNLQPPANENDGLVIYEDRGTAAMDANVPPGLWHYAAFAIDTAGTASEPARLQAMLRSDAEPFADAVADRQLLHANAFGRNSLPAIVLGPPKGEGVEKGSLDVVSLGAASVSEPGSAPFGGSMVVSFGDHVCHDGPGADFTIFENVFYISGDSQSRMMEPAIVSVSQDGVVWHAFPFDFSPRFDPQTGALNLQHPFAYNRGFAGVNPVIANGGNVDPADPSASGGDSFDLADLHVPGLDWIRHIRIQSTGHQWLTDANGDLVPHPDIPNTGVLGRGLRTSGFDLDAVTAIWIDKAVQTP